MKKTIEKLKLEVDALEKLLASIKEEIEELSNLVQKDALVDKLVDLDATPLESNKYRHLSKYLENSNEDTILLSFKEIEEIAQVTLPPSSETQRAFWANTETHSIALSWLSVGFKVEKVDLQNKKLQFVRTKKLNPIVDLALKYYDLDEQNFEKICNKFKELQHPAYYFNAIWEYPHIFVLGWLLNFDDTYDSKAFGIPVEFCRYYNTFEINKLAALKKEEILNWFHNKTDYDGQVAVHFYQAIQRIHTKYHDDVSIIWKNTPSSENVICELLTFEGMGTVQAKNAAGMLAKYMYVKYSNYISIDVDPNYNHFMRVFYRLGFVDSMDELDQAIFKAKEIYPKFPGILDPLLINIASHYCFEHPNCNRCPLKKNCKFALNSMD